LDSVAMTDHAALAQALLQKLHPILR